MAKIGDTVWLFDGSRRVYALGSSGPPLYREHFRPVEITGETKTSWLLSDTNKIDKKTGRLRQSSAVSFGLSWNVYWTPEAVEDACWVQEHRFKLADRVRDCQNAKVLKAIKHRLDTYEIIG